MKTNSLSLRHLLWMVVCSCLVMMVSCQKDEVSEQSSVQQSDDPTLQWLLKMGFSREHIIDIGEFYLVEGDMRFKKSKLGDTKGARQVATLGRLLPSLSNVSYIRVGVNTFPTTAWTQRVVTATQAAISEWGALSNSSVEFVYGGGPSYDITIVHESDLSQATYGSTDYPSGDPSTGCIVGSTVRLNSNTEYLTADQLKFLVTHELGHTLGLLHTDGQQNDYESPYQIPGTPTSDNYSVMNSGTFNSTNGMPSTVPAWSVQFPSGFSTGDRAAISFLFPATASATVEDDNSSTNPPILVTWPPSNFCERVDNNVKIDIYQGSTFIKSSGYVYNNGSYRFTRSGLNSSTTYKFQIKGKENPNDNPLEKQVEFSF